MLKSALRKQALAQRNSLTADELHVLNEKLLTQFKKLDLSNIRILHIFLPIIHQKEPDTFLLIEWLQKNHPEIQIIVPKADFETRLMSNFIYVDKKDLINNQYQIPEPQLAKPFKGIPDMVLIPLLAFDERGYRVGYGKGFYDRFLQNISTQKIGLSFFDAVAEINDVHLNDIRLDKCITPHKIIEFNS
ncbi:5-formyltetrahydrofolate cyclo-ligase [Pedobacter sp. LMG 31464]|uniref:5-formyltetrahydrofolate cyclo-ligase n=1 Tax=Pedobacter planticolens TaxID=2679964 RepID=A0A923E0M0_9SPHI|nr:5-formyltetrahydrofolate cyclo-ligase [Pedobacter planticolens]MBB2146228.1 5-formyltetrahydrofolate cyclo-ligase [Pedobacter planticolens]